MRNICEGFGRQSDWFDEEYVVYNQTFLCELANTVVPKISQNFFLVTVNVNIRKRKNSIDVTFHFHLQR